jgi:branched-chain amino acid transport system substrate-binding protein
MTARQGLARAATAALLVLVLAAHGNAAAGPEKASVEFGFITSTSGLLANYSKAYVDGFYAGLDYATHRTGIVNGHKVIVTLRDDGGDAVKAVAAAKELIGSGTKIIGGAISSGTALQLAPLAAQNKVLFISGGAASDAITGNNRYTFRSGRQTYQDIATAAAILGGLRLQGKTLMVLAQDTAFGQANVNGVRQVLGTERGADVTSLLVPPSANDFTPFAQKIVDAKPQYLFVAWAGTTGPALIKSLDDQHVFAITRFMAGLAERSTWSMAGPASTKVTYLAHYFPDAAKNAVNSAMIAKMKRQGKVTDVFSPDGFVLAQMLVRAIEKSDGTDVDAMIASLEGWTFAAPKGEQTIRPADHAMLQPMFMAKLVGSGDATHPVVLRTLPNASVAPPVKAFRQETSS